MNVLGIIPARYESSRFPGKPLVKIGSKSMIQRVYEQAILALCDVIIATDDERIIDEVKSFHGKAILTSPSHRSGTDRCFEAMTIYEQMSGKHVDAVINIQGDEPFINPKSIASLSNLIGRDHKNIVTLVKQIEDYSELQQVSIPKVVLGKHGEALYFSRFPIPYFRGNEPDSWLQNHKYYKHIGIYAYTREVLSQLVTLEPSSLEKAESLEQLRWLENGYSIFTEYTSFESMSVDTPEDLEILLQQYAERID